MSSNPPGAVTGPRIHPIFIVAGVALAGIAVVVTAALLGFVPMSKFGISNPGSMASAAQQPSGGVASEYPVTQVAEPEERAPAKAMVAPKADVPKPQAAKPVAAPKPLAASSAPAAAKPVAPQGSTPSGPRPSTPSYGSTQVASNQPAASSPARAGCVNCGVVASVTPIETKGQASGAGAIVGGVLGGVIGHQVGSGRGNDVATVAGAAGGAYAGHQIEKNKNTTTTWEVRVRLDDGSSKVVRYKTQPAFRAGDKVRVENNVLVRG